MVEFDNCWSQWRNVTRKRRHEFNGHVIVAIVTTDERVYDEPKRTVSHLK